MRHSLLGDGGGERGGGCTRHSVNTIYKHHKNRDLSLTHERFIIDEFRLSVI